MYSGRHGNTVHRRAETPANHQVIKVGRQPHRHGRSNFQRAIQVTGAGPTKLFERRVVGCPLLQAGPVRRDAVRWPAHMGLSAGVVGWGLRGLPPPAPTRCNRKAALLPTTGFRTGPPAAGPLWNRQAVLCAPELRTQYSDGIGYCCDLLLPSGSCLGDIETADSSNLSWTRRCSV